MGDWTSDAELVAKTRSRDRDAFGTLMERHQPMARRVAFGVVGHRNIADELANEAMLQAYLSLDRLRDDANFRNWLHGIVLNVCRSYIRDRKKAPLSYDELMGRAHLDSTAMVDSEQSPQEMAESRELNRVVLQAVNSLPPKARVTTLLYYYAQFSVREVAETLGMSVSAVKNRLHGARAKLRENLLSEDASVKRSVMANSQEGQAMIQVKVTDVVEQKWENREKGVSWPIHVALLVDQERHRLLPIWLGETEGRAIAAGLENLDTPRPLTYSLIANILVAVDTKLEDVRIDSLKSDTYYASLTLRRGDTRVEVDARPSDAMALALETGTPIHTTEELLQHSGVDIPGDLHDFVATANGAQSILKRFHQTHVPASSQAKGSDESHHSEAWEESKRRAYKQLMTTLFGE